MVCAILQRRNWRPSVIMPQEIKLDALDLAAIIRDGDHIVWGQGAGEPATLVRSPIMM